MTITLKSGSTVMFTGDSITDWFRVESPDGLGSGYPTRVAGEWGFRHPDRPVTWLNTGWRGDKVQDLEARWQADVLDAKPDVLSILVGMNDVAWHTFDPVNGHPFSPDEYRIGYRRLLEPLTGTKTELILIEPFLLPISGVIEHEDLRFDEEIRKQWRADLDPAIEVVHDLAREYGAHLLEADRMFADLSTKADAEHWADDAVHPTSAGHAALTEAWLRLVD
ncbi:SGNH/GDSL hydrolase family protein [Kribbella sp. NPDC058245]|uniref:SGNH/GDSL hydrolase family protein n=1 Tax=Kribbella sp. NPDC058245 TaxID=3346399 RepID=UPI0036EC6818